MGDPDVPKADVGGGADPAERQRVAAVLGLEIHCEQVMVHNQGYRLAYRLRESRLLTLSSLPEPNTQRSTLPKFTE